MKIRNKLLAVPVLAVLLMALMVALSAWGMGRQQQVLQHMSENQFGSNVLAWRARSEAAEVHSSVYRMLQWVAHLDAAKLKQQVDALDTQLRGIESHFEVLRARVVPERRSLLAAAAASHKAYHKLALEAVDLASMDANTGLAAMQSADARYRELAAQLDKLVEAQAAGVRAAEADAAATSSTLVLLMLGAGLLCAALTVAFSLVLGNRLVKSIAQAGAAAQAVARGDLGQPIPAADDDEVGLLLGSMRDMQASLTRVVGSVRSGADSVAAATTEIARGNIDLSSRTEEQASSLASTAASMAQLRTAVQLNADSARLWVKLTVEPFPRLSVVRAVKDDVASGAAYLGPFGSRRTALEAVEALQAAIPLRTCTSRMPVGGTGSACVLAEMGRCPAPCTRAVDVEGYAVHVDAARHALLDDVRHIEAALSRRLQDDLSLDLRYEEAALWRDRLEAFARGAARAQEIASLAALPDASSPHGPPPTAGGRCTSCATAAWPARSRCGPASTRAPRCTRSSRPRSRWPHPWARCLRRWSRRPCGSCAGSSRTASASCPAPSPSLGRCPRTAPRGCSHGCTERAARRSWPGRRSSAASDPPADPLTRRRDAGLGWRHGHRDRLHPHRRRRRQQRRRVRRRARRSRRGLLGHRRPRPRGDGARPRPRRRQPRGHRRHRRGRRDPGDGDAHRVPHLQQARPRERVRHRPRLRQRHAAQRVARLEETSIQRVSSAPAAPESTASVARGSAAESLSPTETDDGG